MATEWVDVADNAVKIGLGSLLTILGGWLTLKLTQKHELKKEAAVQGLKDKEIKTKRYVEFLALSQSLMQNIYMSSVKQITMIILPIFAYIMR
ncbi:hypothetical protein ACRYKO_25130 [Escherichia coli]|uniref:hypothetical protein n=1 Tax=Escherichia coli TaxID=562 RepID=UPI003D8C2A9F